MEESIPYRLAGGAHKRSEGGYACAMEVVSWMAGEPFDAMPQCADMYLALMVQNINDALAETRGIKGKPGPNSHLEEEYLLTPEDSSSVLELGMLTIGTSEMSLRGEYLRNDLLHRRRKIGARLRDVTSRFTDAHQTSNTDKWSSIMHQLNHDLDEIVHDARELLLEIREANNPVETPDLIQK